MTSNRTPLYGLERKALQDALTSADFQPFRGLQVFQWAYQQPARPIEEWHTLPKALRTYLQENFDASLPELAGADRSEEGTVKYGWRLKDGAVIESVFMPAADRSTVCLSSQVGCKMGCIFCLTAAMTQRRDLGPEEIVGQVLAILAQGHPITNMVFMGMGEPLDNLASLITALRILSDEKGLGFSLGKVTISTVGLIPQMFEILEALPAVNLAVSLNATTQEQRERLMPITRKYSLQELLDACRKVPLKARRRLTFEYVMMREVNDTVQDARRMVKLLHGIKCKVNLIPFNESDYFDFHRPTETILAEFREILSAKGVTATIRESQGRKIRAACGQLATGELNPKQLERAKGEV